MKKYRQTSGERSSHTLSMEKSVELKKWRTINGFLDRCAMIVSFGIQTDTIQLCSTFLNETAINFLSVIENLNILMSLTFRLLL